MQSCLTSTKANVAVPSRARTVAQAQVRVN